MTDEQQLETDPAVLRELTKSQRRVLGVLVEKAFTTPEYYPLTLKAITTGCNQKSNRQPVTNYSEDDVFDTLDELRERGLAAVVHTESGRTERFRHYMRHRTNLSEPQLAILTELMLRGRQQLGELRSRASRMVLIDSLENLREALNGLQSLGLIQSSGSLERRGAEVDHNLFTAAEGQRLATQNAAVSAPAVRSENTDGRKSSAQSAAVATATSFADQRETSFDGVAEQLRQENQELRNEIENLKNDFQQLSNRFDDLRRDLGG